MIAESGVSWYHVGMDDTKRIYELWTYEEAARFLHIRPDSLRRKVQYGEVPAHRPFGKKGRVLFDPDELRRLVMEN